MSCKCDLDQIMRQGCICGDMKNEKEEQQKKRDEIIKRRHQALNEGISYEERNKQYGDIKEF